MHNGLHHFEHPFHVLFDLFELAFGQTLVDGFIIDGRLHSTSPHTYSRQYALYLLVKSGPSLLYSFLRMMYSFSRAGRMSPITGLSAARFRV